MTIKTTLTARDYSAFKRHAMFRYGKLHWIFAISLLLLVGSSWFGGEPDEPISQRIAVLSGFIIAWAALIFVMFAVVWLMKRVTGAKFRPQLGEHIFEVSENGVIEENAFGRMETKLTGIKQVDETPLYFFVITTAGAGHIIPKRDVGDANELLVLKALAKGNNG